MEENMQEQISQPLAQPSMPLLPPVKLWTPGTIAGITFLLGFPAGIVLASINWMRMNLSNKALIHLIVGALGTFIVVVFLILTPGNTGRILGLAVNLGTLFYLQRQMKKDLENFTASNHKVEKANGLGGCLIGIGMLVLFFMLAVVLTFVFVALGVPIPE